MLVPRDQQTPEGPRLACGRTLWKHRPSSQDRPTTAAFTAVFQETVVLAPRLGLARLGHVALDGTKLKANTSKHKAMSYGRMRQREAQLTEELARLAEQAEAQDTAEDQEYGVDSDGYSVADELARREARLAKIRAARERLETEQRAEQGLPAGEQPVIGDKEQRSFADDDARIMLMKRGAYDYAYNAQAVVDAESGVIVAAVLTNVAADMRHLPGLVAEVRTLRDGMAVPDDRRTTVSADAGYFSGENADEDGAGLDLLIAAGRDDPAAAATNATVYAVDRFGYDPLRDVWICPADKLLHLVPSTGQRGRPSKNQYVAASADCAACPLRANCLKPGEDHRVVQAKDRRSAGAMRFKLRQPDARRRYARRKAIVEPVFGQLKEARGFTTLSLRGLARAAGEYFLACLAHNLGKLLRVCPLPAARLGPAAA
jgi:transposase